ncbi:MAG: polysaccharide deacetylase family protein [Alphaproteobacteria bacterium]|nr:polysaccharide deacetylase family protein [Alphaproteobacteria bacterium]
MTDFPVVFGTCLDAEAIWLNKIAAGEHRPVLLSHGGYAIKDGLGPLLDLFKTHDVRTTFFIPGVTAERYPEAVIEIGRRGHEIASHGHGHKSVVGMAPEEERSELEDGIAALERIAGERPRTWRSPSWEFTENTMDLMIAAGVTISANYQDSSRPYRHTRDGEALPVVELPVHWHLADAPYFLYGALPGRIPRPADDAYKVWSEEFTGLYEDRPDAFYHGTLHVQLIGHPGRLQMLDRFIRLIKSHERARFMRCDELAATVA